MKTTKLEIIAQKYSEINHNDDNYGIGGGLSSDKFSSRRHEDAKEDSGKLTLGKTTSLFVNATGLNIEIIKELIKYAVPNMEWHHAGMLPKAYGGGMKKTYFLNSDEISNLALNFYSILEKYEISLQSKRTELELKNDLEAKKQNFLVLNATKKIRVEEISTFFYEVNREMNGKYGWFCSYGKSYNMTEYYTGWEFKTQEKYNEFLNIK